MSENKETDKNLKDQNEILENYFRNTIIPQLFIDGALILRKFTPAAMKQFTLSPDDIGKSINDIINNLRFPSVTENIQQVINTSEILEKEIQTTDLRWFQMNILPYVEKTGNKANGVIITFVDISRRIDDLQVLEKLILDHEILLDTISHDIKNPITNLSLSVNMLTKGNAENPHEFKPLLKIIENSVKKLQSIIKELTETRKDEQHKYKPYDELINLEHIIEDVSLTLLDTMKQSGAVLISELNISEIFFSRRKIRSIIYNLVNNAIKFKSPERRPEIFIRTIKENNLIILSVQDNGIGIDPSKQKDIFQKYYRVDECIEGSGIGLHLVRELVTNSGGEIIIESQIDKGTTFKIFLKIK
jgi:two-component system, OmpR family, phosphate regulon sensor histidine kinase PhoR